jgi:hypothetical protein
MIDLLVMEGEVMEGKPSSESMKPTFRQVLAHAGYSYPILETLATEASLERSTVNDLFLGNLVCRPDAEKALAVLSQRVGKPLSLNTVYIPLYRESETPNE